MKLLIGVDIGTQGTKAALFDETGQCLAEAFEKSRLHRPSPGVVEEDPERQFGSVCRTIHRCVRDANIDKHDVAGIGIDGQMAGVIGVGRDGRAVTPYDSWLDTRCAPYIETMNRKAGKRIAKLTGAHPSFNHGPKTLWWQHERKREFHRIAAFVQPGGYAVMRLCGLDGAAAFIDGSYLHFSGFADNRRSRWDASLCRTFDMPLEKLPHIVDSHDVAGELTRDAARRCGLPAGVPVIAGCGDTAASFLACGATEPGVCVDVAGTASVFAATTNAFEPDIQHGILACGRSATPGLWHPFAYINGGGMNPEWFRSQIAGWKRSPKDAISLEELDRIVSTLDHHADAPIFVPHLGGRVAPSQPHMRGAWIGVSWNHSLGDLYRAVLEGVALEYALYKDVLTSLYPDLDIAHLRITGGGASSTPWNRIKADVLQVPIRLIHESRGAPMGAALLAGFGVGCFRSLPAAAKRWIRIGRRIAPRPGRAGDYQHRLKQYRNTLQYLEAFAQPTTRD